ncbi:hypothetical protein [Pseudorhodoferax sp.]|uniref:hypothetical protein n=1 Tax=Pseudorhodoferax sp. TaxID=1993553 RepID=UPI0039E3E9CB
MKTRGLPVAGTLPGTGNGKATRCAIRARHLGEACGGLSPMDFVTPLQGIPERDKGEPS